MNMDENDSGCYLCGTKEVPARCRYGYDTDEGCGRIKDFARDAARYRFLRDHPTRSMIAVNGKDSEIEWISGEEADAVIDAALAVAPSDPAGEGQ
jgi:hypothetical protein